MHCALSHWRGGFIVFEELTQNPGNFNKRESVSEDFLDEMTPFFEKIETISEGYEYITAAERRAFNLAIWYLSDISKLVSNSGMLLQYKKIAEYYNLHKCFPRILVLDDLMMHGRGMSKFLEQLEKLVQDELGYGEWDDYDQMNCRHSFSKSIDIYIYAKNKMPVLLDSRFAWRVYAQKKMDLSQMRDLSLQLSNFLSLNNIANTSFAPTFLNQELLFFLRKKTENKNPVYNISSEYLNLKWFGVKWRYFDEDMFAFFCFHGQQRTTRISTIRFFPSRGGDVKQAISFSLIPDLPERQFNDLCAEVESVLTHHGLRYLPSILKEEQPILRQNKAQLLSYIISAVDYIDFQNTMKDPENQQKCLEKNRFSVDVGKISLNFGLQEDSKRELLFMVSHAVIRKEVREVFSSVLDQDNAENALLDFIPTDPQTVFQPDEIRKYNHVIESIIYDCGAKSEKKALDFLRHSYDFVPSKYQSYSGSSESNGCEDGILSLRELMNKIKLIEGDDRCREDTVVPYLCAYIVLMDNGILGTRLQFVEGESPEMVTILKAGELATFSLPKELSILIPAFAKVSYYGSRLGLTQREAVYLFYSKYYAKVDGLPNGYEDVCDDFFTGMCEEGHVLPSPEKIKEATNKIYNCGQSYGGWNFKNITQQFSRKCDAFQKHLLEEADLFISRNEKYWE